MHLADSPVLMDRRIKEWLLLERARQEESRSQKVQPRGATQAITISRQYCAGGHTIAEKVARLLGPDWQVWDRQIVDEIARSAEVRTQMVEMLDERTRGWMEEMIANLVAPSSLEALGYRRHLTQVLLALTQQGRKIIVGRGANFVLPQALNVRLRASLEFRVHAAMQREGLAREEALRRVHQVDRERSEFTRSVFDRDIEDPAGYDMFLQVDTLGFDPAAEAIAAAARARATA